MGTKAAMKYRGWIIDVRYEDSKGESNCDWLYVITHPTTGVRREGAEFTKKEAVDGAKSGVDAKILHAQLYGRGEHHGPS
jgi:hypothetical protein